MCSGTPVCPELGSMIGMALPSLKSYLAIPSLHRHGIWGKEVMALRITFPPLFNIPDDQTAVF